MQDACRDHRGEWPERDRHDDLPNRYAADDYTALIFRDGEFIEAVAEGHGRYAYRLER